MSISPRPKTEPGLLHSTSENHRIARNSNPIFFLPSEASKKNRRNILRKKCWTRYHNERHPGTHSCTHRSMPVSHIGHTVPLCGDSRLELVLQQQELPHAHIETFPPKSPLALWNHRLSHSLYDSSHRSRYLIKNPDYRRINQIAPFSLFTSIKTKILPHCYINRFSHIDSNIKI